MITETLKQQLDRLSPAKRALLEQRLLTAAASQPAAHTIPRRDTPDRAPLSFAQERLWFLNQLEPESSAYHIAKTLRIRGDLNVAALRQALNAMIARHESLRTRFTTSDGVPLQRIAEHDEVDLPLVDLRQIDQAERDQEARRRIDEIIGRPFDLANDSVLRGLLLRLAQHEYRFVLVRHHIACDRWSTTIFWQELAALYDAYRAGRAANLAPLPIHYADFAAWQRQRLSGEVMQRQLDYWKKQLAGLPKWQLRTDRCRSERSNPLGASQLFALNAEVSARLRALSQSAGTTLFMTLLAAFQTLLHRYSGQQDLAVGSPIAGRNRAEIEGLIGFFTNTLVLRGDLSGDPTFRQLLARVRQSCLGAYAHQDLPFEKLVQELQPERSLSQNPLFQVTFQLNASRAQPVSLAGLQVEEFTHDEAVSRFDLSLAMIERGPAIAGRLRYNADLFDARTIEAMVGGLEHLLQAVASHPEQRIAELPLLSESEKRQQLIECNATASDYPKDQCVHQLFEAQAVTTPGAIALISENRQLTYRQLNQRANQLAHYLNRRGVVPAMVVGICLERSIESIVSLLAILKAGAAYLPLDPNDPDERLRAMIADSQCPIIITVKALLDRAALHQWPAICLDRDRDEISQQPLENLAEQVNAEDLAYVIYTSGSTGTPKGVAIRHRGVVRLLFGVDYARLDDRQTFLQLAPITFDAATFEIWGALLHGAKCVVAPATMLGVRELGGLLAQHQVSVLWLTAALFNIAVDQAPEILRGVKQLLIGGEALSVAHVKKALDRLPDTQIVNGYGPTENTTFTCCYPIPRLLDDRLTSIPIGKPIANTEVYLLDSRLKPVPIGVAGELYIAGDGLAKGYLNRSELTAERFINHGFDDGTIKRLYRSGDLARYLPDGNIEFLGRIDTQVKLRGFRIELGEIEAVLAQHAAVAAAVVSLREDAPGEKRLVAYTVAKPGLNSAHAELRDFLRHKLPDYMIPAAFVSLSELPLNANGKLDRAALPAPDHRRPDTETDFAAPGTPVEELLAGIWRTLLNLDRVGVNDNFFHLGGHSLLATQVISRVQQAFLTDIPLRAIFESPTLAELAGAIEVRIGGQTDARRLPPMAPAPRNQALPLSFAQERLWFLDRLDPGSATYNVPTAFRLSGDLDIRALEQCVNEILCRHEALRTVFPIAIGKPRQEILPPPAFSLLLTDLAEQPEDQRQQMLMAWLNEAAKQPFDLSQGPLFRVRLLRLTSTEHVLALNLHHIIADGWSMGVLFREIAALYRAFSAEESNPLPTLPIQYADYALWQRQWLQGETLNNQLAYWRKRLDGLTTLDLPTDRPRPGVQTHRGARQAIALAPSLSDALKNLSQRQNATLFMTLLAAFQLLLARHCGCTDIAVGVPIAGRNRQDTEGLIGCFVNTLVLRADLSGNPTFAQLLAQVRETTLDAYTHQDLPFEKLVAELQPERNRSISPLFQVMFVLQNAHDPRLQLDGLQAEPLPSAADIAKFDLSMSISDRIGTLRAALKYNTDLFDAAAIERMLGHYKTLLEAIAADPDRRIGELPVGDDGPARANANRLQPAEGQTVTEPREPDGDGQFLGPIGGQVKARGLSIERGEIARVLPRTANEIFLWEIWHDLMALPPRGIDDNFFELGGHSLLAMELAARIEEQFQRQIPLAWLFEHPTIAGLAARLDAAEPAGAAANGGAAQNWRYLFELKPGQGKPPVFLLPNGHGDSKAFLNYAQFAYHVGKEYPFYGLRPRSVGGAQRAHSSVEAMASDYLKEIRSLQPRGPYALVGNCVGGLAAYEIAQQLAAQGEACNLILMDTFAPTGKDYYSYVIKESGKQLERILRDQVKELKYVLRQACSAILLRPAPSAEVKPKRHTSHRIQRRQEAYVRTLRRYRPLPYRGLINLIYNQVDYDRDDQGGWSELVSGEIVSHRAVGNHWSYIREHVQLAAQQVRQCLESV